MMKRCGKYQQWLLGYLLATWAVVFFNGLMSDDEREAETWGLLQWCAVIVVTMLLIACAFIAWKSVFVVRREQAASLQNVRSIGGLLLTWAADNSGIFPDALDYPEGKTANRVFRRLCQDDVWLDERIFGAARSPFKPDGNTGSVPEHEQALEPHENHWMMFGEQSNVSPSNQVVLFENSADASWPPWWHRGVEEPVRGRVWPGGKIAVCFTDCSVMMVTLADKGGKLMLPESVLIPNPNPKFSRPLPSILDIETR